MPHTNSLNGLVSFLESMGRGCVGHPVFINDCLFLRNYCAQRILVPLLPHQTFQDPSHKRDPCQYHANKRIATKTLKTFACPLVHVQTLYAVGRRLEVTELENAMKGCCVTAIPTSADAGRQETCWSRWQGLPRKAFDICYGFSG